MPRFLGNNRPLPGAISLGVKISNTSTLLYIIPSFCLQGDDLYSDRNVFDHNQDYFSNSIFENQTEEVSLRFFVILKESAADGMETTSLSVGEEMTPLTAEEEIYQLCSSTEDVTKINIERGVDPEYVFNSRGQKLHVHSYWPDEGNLSAVVISLHGMGSHSNRPTQRYMAGKFQENGLAYVCIDFHGHGYSEGVKGMVDSLEFLLDDVFSLLGALYSDNVSASGQSRVRTFSLKNRAKKSPFFLMGHSMGGSTALYVGHMLSNRTESSNPNNHLLNISTLFRGCLLVCPAIDIKMPPSIVVTTLDYLIVPFFRDYPIPEIFSQKRIASQHLLWKNKFFQDYVTRDGYPANEKGLSYGDPVKFQTASTLIKLAGGLQSMITKISFPFIVFHDPTEQIVLVKGSKRLLEMSLTAKVNKSIVLVEGGLHDLLSNNFTLVTAKSIEWIQDQMSRVPESKIGCDGSGSNKQTKLCIESHVQKKMNDFYFVLIFILGGLITLMAVLRFKFLFLLNNLL